MDGFIPDSSGWYALIESRDMWARVIGWRETDENWYRPVVVNTIQGRAGSMHGCRLTFRPDWMDAVVDV